MAAVQQGICSKAHWQGDIQLKVEMRCSVGEAAMQTSPAIQLDSGHISPATPLCPHRRS